MKKYDNKMKTMKNGIKKNRFFTKEWTFRI